MIWPLTNKGPQDCPKCSLHGTQKDLRLTVVGVGVVKAADIRCLHATLQWLRLYCFIFFWPALKLPQAHAFRGSQKNNKCSGLINCFSMLENVDNLAGWLFQRAFLTLDLVIAVPTCWLRCVQWIIACCLITSSNSSNCHHSRPSNGSNA